MRYYRATTIKLRCWLQIGKNQNSLASKDWMRFAVKYPKILHLDLAEYFMDRRAKKD